MGFWALSHPLQADPTHEALGSNRELTAVLWGDGGESYLTQHPAINKDKDLHFFFSEFLFQPFRKDFYNKIYTKIQF